MLVLDPWDVVAIVGLALVILGAALVYWPLALILCGGLILAAYTIRETRHAAGPPAPVPADPDRTKPE